MTIKENVARLAKERNVSLLEVERVKKKWSYLWLNGYDHFIIRIPPQTYKNQDFQIKFE